MTVKDELCGHEPASGPSSDKSFMRKSNVQTDKFFLFITAHIVYVEKFRKEITCCLRCYSLLWVFLFYDKNSLERIFPVAITVTECPASTGKEKPFTKYSLVLSSKLRNR